MAPATPIVRLLEGRHKRAFLGHPWVYSNEIDMDPETKSIDGGTIVALREHGGRALGVAMFNPHSLIAARLLSRDPSMQIDAGFLRRRLQRALAVREQLFRVPYYRLVHAEGDGLPGLIIDRYGDTVVMQMNTAGMERLSAPLREAVNEAIRPRTIVMRNDTSVRRLEGLDSYVRTVGDELPAPLAVRENGCEFWCDPLTGQKTGWFYDQRDNRAFVAALSKSRRVADFYTYVGGFAVAAAVAGATQVFGFDRSGTSLELAGRAAHGNGVGDRCRFEKADAFRAMHDLAKDGTTFDVVIADPPAFVKSKRELPPGLRGYRKLTASAARLVAPGGYLLVTSCSHHVDMTAFAEQMRRGLRDARRTGRILRAAGAAPDHPAHIFLPETAYLKAIVLQLD